MSGDGSTLVEVRGLVREFPGTLALAGVDLRVHAGTVHGLVGHNGAGKSTLVKILTGVDRPDAGSIVWKGSEVDLHGPQSAQALGIAVAYQDGNLIPDLRADDFLFVGDGFPRRAGRVDRGAIAAECERLSEALDLPAWIWQRRIADLPGAIKKMVAIAKAVRRGAELIILDEPTSGLPRHEVDEVLATVGRLRDRGVGVLYVTHRLEEIVTMTSEVTVLRHGEVVANLSSSETSEPELVGLIGGRAPQRRDSDRVSSRAAASEAALELSWGEGGADRSLDVHPGEVVGLTGPEEEHIQRMLRRVVGVEAEGGDLRVTRRGQRLRASAPAQALSKGVVYVSSDRLHEGGVADFTLGRNLTLSSLGDHARGPLRIVSNTRERAAAADAAERFGVISHGIDQPFAQLSGGNQQKALVARALAAGADTLLIDSPTVGVDVGARAEMYQLLRQVAAEGKAVLVASSDIDELADLCDRVVAYRDGTVTEVGEGTTTPDRIRAAYFGTSVTT